MRSPARTTLGIFLCLPLAAMVIPLPALADPAAPAAGGTVAIPAATQIVTPAPAQDSQPPSLPPDQTAEEKVLEQELDRKVQAEAATPIKAGAPAPASSTAASPAAAAPSSGNLPVPQKSPTAPATPAVIAAQSQATKDSTALHAAAAASPVKPSSKKSGGVDSLRPKGPVTVIADRAEWQSGGAMVYTGHVSLTSETLQLKGVRLELQQFPDGQYLAKLNGEPARMDHSGDLDDKGQPAPPVTAQGANLTYNSRTGIVDVVGDAILTRGKDEITGSSIHYNVLERRIQAGGDGGGQVRIVIQPPPPAAAPAAPKTAAQSTAAKPASPAVPAPPPPPATQKSTETTPARNP